MKIHLIVAGVVMMMYTNKPHGVAAGHCSAATHMNVSYGTDAKQKMDVYLPANRSTATTKVLFTIHGGSWNAGDKSDFNGYVAVLQQRLPDYAIVNINYRLAAYGRNQFPSQENDVNAAASFVYKQREAYQVSGTFVFLGASAGAHLALLQAYKHQTPVKAAAVVSFFGPADLSTYYYYSPLIGSALQSLLGTTPAMDASKFQQSSPQFFVNEHTPPTLLLQGGADYLVPASQTMRLRDSLQAAEVPNQYIFYAGEGHGWMGKNLQDSFDKIVAFLVRYVP